MAARAMWKGRLRVGKHDVPFKLYAAAADRGVHFRLLHEKDLVPVSQRMAHPETDETVEREDVRQGVQVDRGKFVVLDDEELQELEPEASRDVDVTRFVPPETLDHRWYERPYYLGPDGDEDAYFGLAEALEKSGLEGVARWVMRKREYAGALRARDGHLALVSLRSAEQVVPVGSLEPPSGRALDSRERKLAAQLIDALTGEFDPEEYADEYRERVLALVDAKRKGKKPKLQRFRPAPEPDEESLADVLQRSLDKAG